MLVIPCIERRFDGAPLVVTASSFGSILPAAWSFLLALRSRGSRLGVDHRAPLERTEAAAVLGIPDTVTQVAMFPVAYTVGTDFKRAARPPAESVTFWNTWGADSVNHPVPPLLRPRSSDEYPPVPWDARLTRVAPHRRRTAARATGHDSTPPLTLRALDAVGRRWLLRDPGGGGGRRRCGRRRVRADRSGDRRADPPDRSRAVAGRRRRRARRIPAARRSRTLARRRRPAPARRGGVGGPRVRVERNRDRVAHVDARVAPTTTCC